MPTKLGAFLSQARARLQPVSDTPRLDSQVLAAEVLGVSRSWVLAHPEADLAPVTLAALDTGLQRLASGEPLPYVLGHWEFYNLEFKVGSSVLIPRPETELLVDQALAWLGEQDRLCWGVDIGTGSGCIAISLTANRRELHMLAADISLAALRMAADNAARHNVTGRVHCVQADLLPGLARRLDLVCANLPYIPAAKLAGLKASVYEPSLALNGGADGLDLIRRLLVVLPDQLAPGGRALLEIEASQGHAALGLCRQAYPRASIQLLADLAGRDRLVVIDLPH